MRLPPRLAKRALRIKLITHKIMLAKYREYGMMFLGETVARQFRLFLFRASRRVHLPAAGGLRPLIS
jgi:hypothetical protein